MGVMDIFRKHYDMNYVKFETMEEFKNEFAKVKETQKKRGETIANMKTVLECLKSYNAMAAPVSGRHSPYVRFIKVVYTQKHTNKKFFAKRFGLKIGLTLCKKFVVKEVSGYSSRIPGIVPGLIVDKVIVDLGFANLKEIKAETPQELARRMTAALIQANGVELRFAIITKMDQVKPFTSQCYGH